jgi:hypothetical protein
MSYHTRCDWCGERIDHYDDQAEMPVTIYHRQGKSKLEARWAEETKVTRHFCASPREDTDRGGRDRAGLLPQERLDSCYDRAIATITGVALREAPAGLEWRLVAIEVEHEEEQPARKPKGRRVKVPTPPPSDPAQMVPFARTEITAELYQLISDEIPLCYRFALPAAGIVSLDQAAAMSDDELLALDRVGHYTVRKLREAVARRKPGLAVVREAFGILVHGLDAIADDDPMRQSLSQALEPLTCALAEAAP